MKTQGVVSSLGITDAAASFDFYSQVMGTERLVLEQNMVTLTLPGMMLVLAEVEDFHKY